MFTTTARWHGQPRHSAIVSVHADRLVISGRTWLQSRIHREVRFTEMVRVEAYPALLDEQHRVNFVVHTAADHVPLCAGAPIALQLRLREAFRRLGLAPVDGLEPIERKTAVEPARRRARSARTSLWPTHGGADHASAGRDASGDGGVAFRMLGGAGMGAAGMGGGVRVEPLQAQLLVDLPDGNTLTVPLVVHLTAGSTLASIAPPAGDGAATHADVDWARATRP